KKPAERCMLGWRTWLLATPPQDAWPGLRLDDAPDGVLRALRVLRRCRAQIPATLDPLSNRRPLCLSCPCPSFSREPAFPSVGGGGGGGFSFSLGGGATSLPLGGGSLPLGGVASFFGGGSLPLGGVASLPLGGGSFPFGGATSFPLGGGCFSCG